MPSQPLQFYQGKEERKGEEIGWGGGGVELSSDLHFVRVLYPKHMHRSGFADSHRVLLTVLESQGQSAS